MQNDNIKNLLEEWQMAQHCEECDAILEIESELKNSYNIDMTSNWEENLYKYNLIN